MNTHRFLGVSGIVGLLAAAGTIGIPAIPALASSHREAPGITEMPKVDSTDFYMFRSYEAGREGFVTLTACYQPFQTPYGGPNFFQMDSDALYQIHVDNDGDGNEDITFTFRFTNTLRNLSLNIGGQTVAVPIYNIGPIGPAGNMVSNLNIIETYTVDVTFGDRYTGQTIRLRDAATNSETFSKPADSVGGKSFSNYETYARNHITSVNLPGARFPGRIFVGQRKDPFVVNLGETFDLVNLNPLGPENGKADTLKDNNVTALCVEVPAQWLRQGRSRIIGGWTTASLPRRKVFKPDPTFDMTATSGGPFVQVSRLGMPLVNELVIGIPDKDRFGAARPSDDAQFLTYVTNPVLPVYLQALFPSVTAPTLPRNDLVSVFLTGVAGLNQPANVRPAEMLRLNTDILPKARGQQSRLGVLASDTAGFPNGRRPGDDVVDIELRVVMGALYPDAGVVGGNAPSGALAFTDGARLDDSFFDAQFPYLRTPVVSSPNTAAP